MTLLLEDYKKSQGKNPMCYSWESEQEYTVLVKYLEKINAENKEFKLVFTPNYNEKYATGKIYSAEEFKRLENQKEDYHYDFIYYGQPLYSKIRYIRL